MRRDDSMDCLTIVNVSPLGAKSQYFFDYYFFFAPSRLCEKKKIEMGHYK